MDKIATMYFTTLPLILGGIANMIFTKTALYKKYKCPIDNNKQLWDGKRLFGDNKTWIGFVSMVVFCTIFQVLMGVLCEITGTEHLNTLYGKMPNLPHLNAIYGVLIGIAYMLCELPNSFIKRRIDIPSGKTARGVKGTVFFIVDQFDSMIGVMLILCLFAQISAIEYVQYVLLGGITHFIINGILYLLKIRKNL